MTKPIQGSVSLPSMEAMAFAYLEANLDDDSPLLAWEIRQEMHRRAGVEHTLKYIEDALEVREMCGLKNERE